MARGRAAGRVAKADSLHVAEESYYSLLVHRQILVGS
jgi:hypothetical protein